MDTAKLMTREQAAEYLGISVWTIDRLRRGRVLHPIMVPGGCHVVGYRTTELDRLLDGTHPSQREVYGDEPVIN